MLNEELEFKAYVTNPKSENPRVTLYTLTDHFSKEGSLIGIEEIMTVIARAYIYSDDKEIYDSSGKVNEQLLNDTIELLQRWAGFENTEVSLKTENSEVVKWMKTHFVVEGWLKEYIFFHFDNIEKEKPNFKVKKEEYWKTLQTNWIKKLNSPMDYQAEKITYKNVIANALEKGPLQNRYLIVKKSEEQLEDKKVNDISFKYLTDKSSMQVSSYIKIMKVIAAYLINKEYHPAGQKEVWIKSSDLSRWYALDDGKNGLSSWYPCKALWNGNPIYICNGTRWNFTKVSIDQDYLEEFDFRIVNAEECDIEKYKETHWILKDLGHGLKDCWEIINKTPV